MCCTFAFGWVKLKGSGFVPALVTAPAAGTVSGSGKMQSFMQCSG